MPRNFREDKNVVVLGRGRALATVVKRKDLFLTVYIYVYMLEYIQYTIYTVYTIYSILYIT